MKQRIPDQAEKLRQLAAQEDKTDPASNIAAATLDVEDMPSSADQDMDNRGVVLAEENLSSPDISQSSNGKQEKTPRKLKKQKKKGQPDKQPEARIAPQEQTTQSKEAAPTQPAAKKAEQTTKPRSETQHETQAVKQGPPPEPKTEPKAKPANRETKTPPPASASGQKEQAAETKKPAAQANTKTQSDTSAAKTQEPKSQLEPRPKPESKPQKETKADQIAKLFSKKRFPVENNTKVIAITGGKGGVGKSNVACNLAIALSQMKKRVMLLDADLSLANIDVLLGITPRLNLSHVIRGEKTLNEIIFKGPEGISIIPGGSGLEELSNLPLESMERVFDIFGNLSPAPDVLIIDTAAGIHPNVIQFLMAADQTIVVTTPEPTAYTDAYALIKTLIKHDPQKDIGVLVNMAGSNGEATEVMKLMLQICKRMLHITFNNIGSIPRDPAVTKSVRHQKPFLLTAPNTEASMAIRRIAATILQIQPREKKTGGLGQFFRRLFTAKKSQQEQKQNSAQA